MLYNVQQSLSFLVETLTDDTPDTGVKMLLRMTAYTQLIDSKGHKYIKGNTLWHHSKEHRLLNHGVVSENFKGECILQW